jgi:peptide/nickel transport system permease protein
MVVRTAVEVPADPTPRLNEPSLVARAAHGFVARLRELTRRPKGLAGVTIVTLLVIVAIFAPVLAPYNPQTLDLTHVLAAPSGHHLLGTDQLGRDLLSRLLYGTRIALEVAVPAVLGAVALGLLIGVCAGYAGGLLDDVLVIVMDTLQSMPAVVLALILVALSGPSLRNVILVIIFANAPGYARISRAMVLGLKESAFVKAERSLGASDGRIIGVHLLPNIVAPLFILFAMDMPFAITVESGLSFLGLGVRPPTPSWGVIMSDGFTRVFNDAWPIVFASAALMIATLGWTMLGEALRDTADPRVASVRKWRP